MNTCAIASSEHDAVRYLGRHSQEMSFVVTTARKFLVEPTVTPIFDCISRCVRRAFPSGGENAHRKQWIKERLRELARIVAVEVFGCAILGNQLHLLLWLDLAVGEGVACGGSRETLDAVVPGS